MMKIVEITWLRIANPKAKTHTFGWRSSKHTEDGGEKSTVHRRIGTHASEVASTACGSGGSTQDSDSDSEDEFSVDDDPEDRRFRRLGIRTGRPPEMGEGTVWGMDGWSYEDQEREDNDRGLMHRAYIAGDLTKARMNANP